MISHLALHFIARLLIIFLFFKENWKLSYLIRRSNNKFLFRIKRMIEIMYDAPSKLLVTMKWE